MKQIYFTFCQTNYSLNGRGGDSARAASSGISGAETELLKPICTWSAPEKLLDYSPEERLEFVPKALKYTEVSGQKILVHSVYALPDKETKREGNYFAHLLLDLPEDWNVKKSLELWGSPFWKTSDSLDIPSVLPDVRISDCIPGKINDESFSVFIQDSWHADLFRFLLQNWLVRKPEESIVLCCKPEEAAFCLWGLTRYLPQTYWNSLTFSTYEKPRELLSYDVTTFAAMGEIFQESEQNLVYRLQKKWPQVRIFPREVETNEKETPFVADWIDLIQSGKGDEIRKFFEQVPEKYYHNIQIVYVFWAFLFRKLKNTNCLVAALKFPELHSQAENDIIETGNFELEKAFKFLPQLTQAGQEVLLNRLLKEKTLAEIRENPIYSKPLADVLTGKVLPSYQPPKPVQRELIPTPQATRRVEFPQTMPPVKPKKGCFGLFLVFLFLTLVYSSLLLVIFMELF